MADSMFILVAAPWCYVTRDHGGRCNQKPGSTDFNDPNVSNLNEFGSATNTLSLNLQGLQPDNQAVIRTKISDAVDLRAWSVDPDSTTSTMTVDQQGNGTIINGSLAGRAQAGITVAIPACLPRQPRIGPSACG
jgi:hypothetical protein